jgi:amino acid adenylation domain-containing protein
MQMHHDLFPAHFLRIDQLFSLQASQTPGRIAILDDTEAITYSEADRRAALIAGMLAASGVAPGDLVGLRHDRTPDLPLAVLGILRAGAAYLPLDQAYPDERLAYVAAASGLRFLMSDSPVPPPWAGDSIRHLHLTASDDLSRFESFIPAARSADGLAYVLFTSGSTGRPKGVAMSHQPLFRLVRWHAGTPGLREPARVLQFAPLGFDVSAQEIFATLLFGGTVVMVSDEVRRSPFALLDHLIRHRVERLFLPFVAADGLCQAAIRRRARLDHLRDVITAGEQLRITPAIREAFTHNIPGRLHNHYGPTETHIVIAHTLDGKPADWPALPPIGQPIAGATAYIVDDAGNPVTDGTPGELLIGRQLARGYLGRDDLTAERFVERADGERVYRTGDLARVDEHGDIQFLGRTDDQVKIRGFRVEPSEVEVVLSALPGVRSVSVLAQLDQAGSASLTAYLAGDFGAEAAVVKAARDLAAKRLPEYMIPARIRVVENLPITANGKVARGLLSASGGTG